MIRFSRQRQPNTRKPATFEDQMEPVSIIIPTLNETKNFERRRQLLFSAGASPRFLPIVWDISTRDNALRATAIMAVVQVFFSIRMCHDACWALGAGNQKSWIGIGVPLDLGLFSKYTIALPTPALFIVLRADSEARYWLLKPTPYFAAARALLVFSPVIIWNMEHGRTDTSKRHYTFAFTLIIVPLRVLVIFSLSKEVKFNWTGPLWLAAPPYMAATRSPDYGASKERRGGRLGKAWKGTFFLLLGA